MTRIMLSAALLALLTTTGCHTRGEEVQPRSYDALALGTGHWEWDNTTAMSGRRTPVTEGFTRQLVFSAEGQVLIQHGGKLNKQTAYQLSMGPLPHCGSPQASVPIITFETDSDVPNNDRKTYTLTKSATSQSLALVGDAACIDGGAYEMYHWVAE